MNIYMDPTILLRGVLGLAVIIGLATLMSSNRRAIPWGMVLVGIGLQVLFAIIVLKTEPGRAFFEFLGEMFSKINEFGDVGGRFLFGRLVPDAQGTQSIPNLGFVFAVRVLPTIIFFAALMGVLYYLGVMQKIVFGLGWFMAKTLRLSGAESLSTAADVFLGQTEAPLVVRPYIERMTRSELFTLMTAGMATLAGGVLVAYVGMLGGNSPEQRAMFATHLLSVSLMSVVAAVVLSKIMVPETGTPETLGKFEVHTPQTSKNAIEAAANGAHDGLHLALNVGAMLIAFLALLALVNALLGWVGAPNLMGWRPYDINGWIRELSSGNFQSLSLQSISGFLFAPLAWCMGVEAKDVLQFGRLLGEKMALNEFVAYSSLGRMQFDPRAAVMATFGSAGSMNLGSIAMLGEIRKTMDPRSVIMATYALAGFANFGSIAIQIGGTGSLAPGRKSEIAELGLRAVVCGSLATCMTAVIAGVMV